ncbi:uncharacterized protein zgc:174945 [Triplophysa rosa]|uniref:uncharacterized protein zgc:174945 n=1 Tax=Triplophysa rosa TaxID=992332 RepID=UPI00254608A6|nr:uncharacterized protein zgc:174945 [Triplophysa rosa]
MLQLFCICKVQRKSSFCGGAFDQPYAAKFSHFLKLSERCRCKMQVSHPNSMFLLFAVFCYLPSYIAGVAVKYSREPFTKAEGASLSLTCMVQFGKKACKEIQSKWCLLLTPDNCKPLIDPHRYIIHVNETEDREYRLRRIFITFNSLNLQDSGYYQCNAKCESGTEAKGHLVHLAVTGPNVSKWSGQHKVDPALFTLSVILLLWS